MFVGREKGYHQVRIFNFTSLLLSLTLKVNFADKNLAVNSEISKYVIIQPITSLLELSTIAIAWEKDNPN